MDSGDYLAGTKVTIGVCVRNCADTIRETIESILIQDYPQELMELVFVDGYSQDRTLTIIKQSLEQTDLKYRIFYESEGLGRARQIVVDYANADYIIWVDGDMILSNDFVREQVKFMDHNPDVGIAKGKYALTPGANWISTLEIYSRAASKMVDFNYKDKAHAKSMGTSGCIYRVRAIKQVGGFDESIKGYGEDFDAEYRVRTSGWLLCTTHVQYGDYERHGLTWSDLWLRYLKRGYDMYLFLYKKNGLINFHKMLPITAFFAGLFHSAKIYRLTNRKVVFLLPLQYTLKATAWCLGFIKANLSSYGS